MIQATAHEVPDAGGLAEKVEDPIIVLYLDHEIARIEFALAHDPFAVAHLRHLFDGDDDLTKVFLEPLDLHAALNGLLDRLFPATLDLDHVPAFVILAGGLLRFALLGRRRLWRSRRLGADRIVARSFRLRRRRGIRTVLGPRR